MSELKLRPPECLLHFCRLAEQLRRLGLPRFAQLLAAREHVRFGLFETAIDAAALYRVARTTAGHQVLRILLTFASPRNDEINRHDQSVLEVGHPVQPTVLATELIAFQNTQTLLQGHWLVHQRKRRKVQRHRPPPNRKSSWLVRDLRFQLYLCARPYGSHPLVSSSDGRMHMASEASRPSTRRTPPIPSPARVLGGITTRMQIRIVRHLWLLALGVFTV